MQTRQIKFHVNVIPSKLVKNDLINYMRWYSPAALRRAKIPSCFTLVWLTPLFNGAQCPRTYVVAAAGAAVTARAAGPVEGASSSPSAGGASS